MDIDDDDGVIRAVRVTGGFYTALKAPAEDEELSYEARGVLSYIFTKPPSWRCKPKDLIKKSPAGRDKVYRILRELRSRFYLHRYQKSYGNGKFGKMIYKVYEDPRFHPEFDPAKATTVWATAYGFSGSGEGLMATAYGDAVHGDQGKTANAFPVHKDYNNNLKKENNNNVEPSVSPRALHTTACSQCRGEIEEGKERKFSEKGFEGKVFCLTCGDILDVMLAWQAAFPRINGVKKTYPKLTTIRAKAVTRLKVPSFKEDCLEAIKVGSKNLGLIKNGWFQLAFLIKNEVNVQKVLNGTYDFLHDQEKIAGKIINGQGFEQAWGVLAREMSAVGANRKHRLTDPALQHVIEEAGWRNLCRSDVFSAKQLAKTEWNNYHAAGVVVQAVASPSVVPVLDF